MDIDQKTKQWLNDRGITDSVLNHNNITTNSKGQIVIPVFSRTCELLFYKYRRSPFSDEGPKYTYDKGSTGALFNTNNLRAGERSVVIVEGELDAMRLQSGGYLAVSTTGGSGTFKKEWAELLAGYEIYICYDNDEAGITGALRVIEIFPDARIIEIPRGDAVKDVTDYLSKGGDFVALFNGAQTWANPIVREDTKKALTESVRELRAACENLSLELRHSPTPFAEALLKHLQAKWESAHKKLTYKRPENRDTDAIKKARAVPITEYIKFVQGFALCVSHNEKTPSMKYYKSNNKVKCFGCGFNGDTVDVVAKMFNLSVGEAIKKING